MTYVSHIIMLYTLNLYSAVCQLYLCKTGRKKQAGTSLVVQWLRLRAFNAEGTGSIPGGRTKILYAVWRGKKQNKKPTKQKKIKHPQTSGEGTLPLPHC